jgi:hypothetical protein
VSDNFLAEDWLGTVKLPRVPRQKLVGYGENLGPSAAQRRNPERNGGDKIVEILSHPPGFDFFRKFAARTTQETAGWRLLGVKICVDDEFLKGKAKVCYFSQIDSFIARKSGQQGGRIGLAAANLRQHAARAIRLRMDLRGNESLAGAMLAQDQDRAVAFGYPSNRALNPRVNRADRFYLPFPILNRSNCNHKETKVHPFYSNAASKPGAERELDLPCGICALGRASSVDAKELERLFPLTRKNCTIYISEKWKAFSINSGKLLPNERELMENSGD